MKGYDLELISEIIASVQIPVIGCSGANSVEDFDRNLTRREHPQLLPKVCLYFTESTRQF